MIAQETILPGSRPPRLIIQPLDTDSPCFSLKHAFLSPADRDRFVITAITLMRVSHRNVLRAQNPKCWDEGIVYFCELQAKLLPFSLDSYLYSLPNIPLPPLEPILLITDISAALSSLDSHSIQCSVLHPAIISRIDRTYMLDCVSFPLYPDPTEVNFCFFSPESREALKSGVQSTVGTKSLVYSLGLLAVYMLKPAIVASLPYCQAVETILKGLKIDPELRELLLKMTENDVNQRISLESVHKSAQILRDRKITAIMSDFSTSFSESGKILPKSNLEPILFLDFVAVTVTFPCIQCGKSSQTSVLQGFDCQKHVVCPDCISNTANVCPVCGVVAAPKPKRRIVLAKKQPTEVATCSVCSCPFSPSPEEPWRLALLGSSLASTPFCSEQCLAVSSQQPKEVEYEEQPEMWNRGYEGMHFRDRDIEASALFQSAIEEFNGDVFCHFCKVYIESIHNMRLIVCNHFPRCICSKSCLLHSLTYSPSDPQDCECVGCGGLIESRRIRQTLNMDDYSFIPGKMTGKECAECMSPGTIPLPCSHLYCDDCYRFRTRLSTSFPCQECSRPPPSSDWFPL